MLLSEEDNGNLIVQLTELFMAGSDTASTTLAAALPFLAGHQKTSMFHPLNVFHKQRDQTFKIRSEGKSEKHLEMGRWKWNFLTRWWSGYFCLILIFSNNSFPFSVPSSRRLWGYGQLPPFGFRIDCWKMMCLKVCSSLCTLSNVANIFPQDTICPRIALYWSTHGLSTEIQRYGEILKTFVQVMRCVH